MSYECDGCGNKLAYRLSITYTKQGNHCSCDRCGSVSANSAWIPDVYWPGHAYKSANITDSNGDPILLESRRHKAQIMREQGIQECGDKFHGDYVRPQKIEKRDTRSEVRQSLAKAMDQMKRKYRR